MKKPDVAQALRDRIAAPAQQLTRMAIGLVQKRSDEWTGGVLPKKPVMEGVGEDKTAADELFQWATNENSWYTRWATPVIKNMQAKFKKGKYDKTLSLKAWEPAAKAASDAYAKKFGVDGSKGKDMFTPASLKMVAVAFANEYEEEITG